MHALKLGEWWRPSNNKKDFEEGYIYIFLIQYVLASTWWANIKSVQIFKRIGKDECTECNDLAVTVARPQPDWVIVRQIGQGSQKVSYFHFTSLDCPEKRMDVDYLSKLLQRMSRLCTEIIKAKGGYTDE